MKYAWLRPTTNSNAHDSQNVVLIPTPISPQQKVESA